MTETRFTKMEARVLDLLQRNAGQIVARTFFLENVWGYKSGVKSRTLDVHISKLRAKLAIDPNLRIRAVAGLGYRLERGQPIQSFPAEDSSNRTLTLADRLLPCRRDPQGHRGGLVTPNRESQNWNRILHGRLTPDFRKLAPIELASWGSLFPTRFLTVILLCSRLQRSRRLWMGHQASSFRCILTWIQIPALLAKAPGAARPQPCFRMLLHRIRFLSSVSAVCIRRRNAKGDVMVCATGMRNSTEG